IILKKVGRDRNRPRWTTLWKFANLIRVGKGKTSFFDTRPTIITESAFPTPPDKYTFNYNERLSLSQLSRALKAAYIHTGWSTQRFLVLLKGTNCSVLLNCQRKT